jgi:hypothetical protein
MTQVMEVDSEVAETRAEPVLKPQVSAAWALRLAHLPAVAALGVFFLLLNYLPLRPTDLWVHVAWGDWIITHRSLPVEDPTFALAAGMKVVDTAWLSQVLFAGIERAAGPAWLSNTFALVSLATWLIFWRALYLRTNNWLTSFAMLVVVIAISFSRLMTIRPETFGALCFAMLWWLTAPRPNEKFAWHRWLGVPVLMMVWANLHGSFLCGLLVLFAQAAGEFLSALAKSRSLAAAFRSPVVQQSAFVAELGLLATFINPYGLDLLLTAVLFSGNANLRDVLEWQPFTFGGPGSYEFVASGFLAMLLFRFSRQPVSAGNLLALGVFVLATLAGNRMVGWYAMTFGVAFLPLLHDLLGQSRLVQRLSGPAAADEEPGRGFPLVDRSWSYSLIALLFVWISFALSPVSAAVLGTKERTPAQLFGPETPVALSNFLHEHPIVGPTFCPQWWGDWLHRTSPGLQPMMTSNIHLAPRQVWSDYHRISGIQAGWGNVLGRYGIEHIIVDKQNQPELERALRREQGWQVQYEDDRAALYGLRKPTLSNRTPPLSAPKQPVPKQPAPK